MRWLALAVSASLFAPACTGAASPDVESSSSSPTPTDGSETTASSPGLGVISFAPRPHCRPPGPTSTSSDGLVEVHGIAPSGQLWALVFDRVPVPVGRQVKIAWRMTGVGSLRLLALGEHQQAIPAHDLVKHGGSNWNRPGDEWGAFFVFPSAGCWDIQARRGSVKGDVWLVAK